MSSVCATSPYDTDCSPESASTPLLSAVEKFEIANQIQSLQYADDEGDAAAWRISFIFCRIGNFGKWVKVNYDHMIYNGLDAATLFKKKMSELGDLVENFATEDKKLWIEAVDRPDEGVFVGPPKINGKELMRDFNDSFNGVFYIPIDMSHAFGAPALINYSFTDPSKFDEHWDDIRRIKKNENDYIMREDRWRNHLNPQPAWVTFLRVDIDSPICFHSYSYDPENLQGLGVAATNNCSYWTFSFFANPSAKEYFINKYSLTPFLA